MNKYDAAVALDMTRPQYDDMLNSSDWSLHRITTDNEDGTYTVSMIYMDGDGGAMFFGGYSEIFEDAGITCKLIECEWCDIPRVTFLTILKTIGSYDKEKAANDLAAMTPTDMRSR